MPLYEVTGEGLKRRPPAAFAALDMYERAVCSDCSATRSRLDEDLLVIAEALGNWEDARRRIDLLASDKAAGSSSSNPSAPTSVVTWACDEDWRRILNVDPVRHHRS